MVFLLPLLLSLLLGILPVLVKLEGLGFARKSPLPTAKLHAMVRFGGVLLAVVVVVVAGLPGVEGTRTENSQIWKVIFFIMKLI